MFVQPGLCRTWSETPKTGFLTTRLIFEPDCNKTNSIAFCPVIKTVQLGHQQSLIKSRFLHANSKDSDQNEWKPSLIRVFLGFKCLIGVSTLLFVSIGTAGLANQTDAENVQLPEDDDDEDLEEKIYTQENIDVS